MNIAAHSVVVELRMLARPLEMCCSPQAINTHGTSALVTAMKANRPIRFLRSVRNGFPIASMITARAIAPDADRPSTMTVGAMSCRATLMKRNEPPQISPRPMKATYGRSRFCPSPWGPRELTRAAPSSWGLDTRRPVVRGEHQRDRAVVFDADPHYCSKTTGLRLYSALAKTLNENRVQLLGARGIARTEQAGTPAPAHVREEGELRDDQRRALHVD